MIPLGLLALGPTAALEPSFRYPWPLAPGAKAIQ